MSVAHGRRITVLNSSQEFLELIDWLLDVEGPYRVTTMRVPDTTVEELAVSSPEVVVVDIVSSDDIADQLIRDALEHPALQGVPMVLTSPATPRAGDRLADLIARPNIEYLPKPFTAPALEELVRRLLPSVN